MFERIVFKERMGARVTPYIHKGCVLIVTDLIDCPKDGVFEQTTTLFNSKQLRVIADALEKEGDIEK